MWGSGKPVNPGCFTTVGMWFRGRVTAFTNANMRQAQAVATCEVRRVTLLWCLRTILLISRFVSTWTQSLTSTR
jgi:hypothetical protein